MDAWHRELDVCESKFRATMELLTERSKTKPSSRGYSNITDRIRESISQFSNQIRILQSGIGPGLTEGEQDRRMFLVDGLKTKERRLRDLFANTPVSSAEEDKRLRSQLLDVNEKTSSSTKAVANLGVTGWGDGVQDAQEVFNDPSVARVSSEQLRSEQDAILQAQDAGLDSLHEVIVRQKRLAATIGGEAEAQNEMLDDIGDTMDQTRQRLIETTNNVRNVHMRDRTCWYWVIIVILFIAIVIIAIL